MRLAKLMLPLLIAIPLLLAIAAHEWPMPWAGLATSVRLCGVLAVPGLLVILGCAAGRVVQKGRPSWLPMIGWLGSSLALTLLLGWSQWVTQRLADQGSIAGGVILLPHLLSLLAAWTLPLWVSATGTFSVAASDFGRRWTQVRHELLFRCQWYLLPILLPLFVVLAARDLLEGFPDWAHADWTVQVAWLSLTSMVVVLLIFPHLLNLCVSTIPILNPTLQRPLAKFAGRLGLQISEIVQWQTQFRVANAMVVGWLPGMRRILISDVLCAKLSSPELFAVFLHEAGHVRRHHMWWRLSVVVFGCLTLLLVSANQSIVGPPALWPPTAVDVPAVRQVWEVSGEPVALFAGVIGENPRVSLTEHGARFESREPSSLWPLAATIANLGALLLMTTCLLGYVSRALEYEADDFALEQIQRLFDPRVGRGDPTEPGELDFHCRPQHLLDAIRKTAELNGIDHQRVTWMHPSIEQRMERIGWIQASTVYRRLASRRIKMLKLLLLSATMAWTILLFINSR